MSDDFRFLYPDVKNSLHLKWEGFISKIKEQFSELISDREYIKLLNILNKSNLSQGNIKTNNILLKIFYITLYYILFFIFI